MWLPEGLSGPLEPSTPENPAPNYNEATDRSLKTYLDAVRSIVAYFGFGGSDDPVGAVENGHVVSNLACTTQHAYDTLHQNGYNLQSALQAIRRNPFCSKVSIVSFCCATPLPQLVDIKESKENKKKGQAPLLVVFFKPVRRCVCGRDSFLRQRLSVI